MDEDIKTLCRNIKRLGGVAIRDGGGANHGHMISQLTEKNIMLTAYGYDIRNGSLLLPMWLT